jgi:hypothetical protein
VGNQCRHAHPIHNFVNHFWNKNNQLRYKQHVLMEGLSATNTHPNIVRSCGQHHPDDCEFNDKWVSNTWKLLVSRGIIVDSNWTHSLQLMNAVLLHYDKELKEDGDPKEVVKLIIDEKIEYKSTATEHPGSDVPREHVDMKITRLDKVQDQPDRSKQQDNVIRMNRLRSIYMSYCIPEFTKLEGFGSSGRNAFLNVVAARPTKQHVLGAKERDICTDALQWLSADDQRFLTFLKDDWWPLFQVLTTCPYTTFGQGKSQRNEFHSQHVAQLIAHAATKCFHASCRQHVPWLSTWTHVHCVQAGSKRRTPDPVWSIPKILHG